MEESQVNEGQGKLRKRKGEWKREGARGWRKIPSPTYQIHRESPKPNPQIRREPPTPNSPRTPNPKYVENPLPRTPSLTLGKAGSPGEMTVWHAGEKRGREGLIRRGRGKRLGVKNRSESERMREGKIGKHPSGWFPRRGWEGTGNNAERSKIRENQPAKRCFGFPRDLLHRKHAFSRKSMGPNGV